jgi:hypothetical protein
MFVYVDIGVIVDHVEYVIMFVYVDIGVIVDHIEYVIDGKKLHQYQQNKQSPLRKVLTLMVKNYTNINKTNNHL